jgi:hypothetical protein
MCMWWMFGYRFQPSLFKTRKKVYIEQIANHEREYEIEKKQNEIENEQCPMTGRTVVC